MENRKNDWICPGMRSSVIHVVLRPIHVTGPDAAKKVLKTLSTKKLRKFYDLSK
jgi:hypothetical protein